MENINLKGKKLEEGDTIGLVAPANFVEKHKILEAKKKLESLGYKVKIGKNAFNHWHSFAGTDKERLEDINTFFSDSNIHAIMCLRGGFGSVRLIEDLDFNTIKNNPKIFIGYSDITTLHSGLNKRCNLVTFHGPMAVSNFLDLDNFTLKSFLESVTSTEPIKLINPQPLRAIKPGIAQGVVIGGNFITLLGDLGTPNELDFKNKILFIEEIKEPTYKIDRGLTQLLNAGKLQQLAGIILGDFNDCIPASTHDISLEALFLDRFKDLNIPIISNFKSGHCSPMMTIPLGIKVEIDCDNLEIKTLEGAVL